LHPFGAWYDLMCRGTRALLGSTVAHVAAPTLETLMTTKAANNAPRKSLKTRAKAAVAVRRKAARQSASPAAAVASPGSPAPRTKQGQLIAQLSTATGATIAELIALTGWQAHTVRGTISGTLRKRLGLRVIRDKPASGESRYRIETSART
jgi:hypothetical protein